MIAIIPHASKKSTGGCLNLMIQCNFIVFEEKVDQFGRIFMAYADTTHQREESRLGWLSFLQWYL